MCVLLLCCVVCLFGCVSDVCVVVMFSCCHYICFALHIALLNFVFRDTFLFAKPPFVAYKLFR